MIIQIVSDISDKIARFVSMTLGVAISVSTSLTSICMAFFIPAWFFSKKYKNIFNIIISNKYIWALLIFIGFNFVGIFYSEAPTIKAFGRFLNYLELLLILMLIPFFVEEKARRKALNIFLITMCIVLVISYLIYFGFLPDNQLIKGNRNDAAVFLNRIDQNVFMAFCAFIFAVRIGESKDWRKKGLYFILTILVIINITVMVGGKQGYVVLIMLTAYYFFSIFRWKGFALAVLAVSVFAVFTYMSPSSRMHQSFKDLFVTMSEQDLLDFQTEETKMTSAGIRLSHYNNTLKIIFENPVFGVGTGGFPYAHLEKVKDTKMPKADTPHSEYLMIASELGLVGLFAFFFLLYRQFRLANDLPSKSDKIIATGFIIVVISMGTFSGIFTAFHKRIFYIWMSALLFSGYNSELKK